MGSIKVSTIKDSNGIIIFFTKVLEELDEAAFIINLYKS